MLRVFHSKTTTDDEEKRDNFVFCTVVGDKKVGKTCLTHCYTHNSFSENHNATVFDNYPVPVQIGGEDFIISLFDTSGLSNYESLRAYTYEKSEVLVLCFSLCDRESFYNVVNSWMPEIQRHSKRRLPLLLVGTQMDLRTSSQTDQVVRHISLRSSDDVDQTDRQREFTRPLNNVDRMDKQNDPKKALDDQSSQLDLTSSNNVDQTRTRMEPRSSSNINEGRTQCVRSNGHQEHVKTQQRRSSNNPNQAHTHGRWSSQSHHQVNTQANLRSSGSPDQISREEGQYLAKVIGADCYIECSAKSQEGVEEVFHHIVFSALKYRTKKRKIFTRLFEDLQHVSAHFKNCSLPGVFGSSKVSSC